jgi:hypothetical protein
MDDEERSILFLEEHIGTTFGVICEEYIIRDLKWMEQGDGYARAYATMISAEDPTGDNLILLFPLFEITT